MQVASAVRRESQRADTGLQENRTVNQMPIRLAAPTTPGNQAEYWYHIAGERRQ